MHGDTRTSGRNKCMKPIDLLADLVVDVAHGTLQLDVSSGSLAHRNGVTKVTLWCQTAYENTFPGELGSNPYRSETRL